MRLPPESSPARRALRGDGEAAALRAALAAAGLLVGPSRRRPLLGSKGAQMTFIGTAAQSPVVPDDSRGARPPCATNTLRDLDREHAFLVEAARGHHAFVTHCTTRLAAGEELYGDSWAWIGIRKHLAELLEEAADLGAWAVLAHQALPLEPRLSAVDRQRVAGAVAAAAAHGARAHAALTAAVTALGTMADDGEAVA